VTRGLDRHGQPEAGREMHGGPHVGLIAGRDHRVRGGDGGQVESAARRLVAGGAGLMNPARQRAVKGGVAVGHDTPVKIGAASGPWGGPFANTL